MTENLVITRLGSHGDGIAETAAGDVYVPYTLPGETAEVETWAGHADRRRLNRIAVASPARTAPICPHFGACGGCALQHLAAGPYRDWKRGLVTAALARAGLDVDVRGSGRLTAADTAALARVAERRNLARLTRHGELVAQRSLPILTIGRAQVVLSPGAFLQATSAGEAILAQLVVGYCQDARTAADLFCGLGPFALRLAECARITALDSDANAIAALLHAAAATPGLKPVAAQQRDLFRRPLATSELKGFD